MQPGVKTSEFMALVAAKLVSLLIVAGVISASQQDQWQTNVANALVGIIAIWQILAGVRAYIESRTGQKRIQLLKSLGGNPPRDDDRPPPAGSTRPFAGRAAPDMTPAVPMRYMLTAGHRAVTIFP